MSSNLKLRLKDSALQFIIAHKMALTLKLSVYMLSSTQCIGIDLCIKKVGNFLGMDDLQKRLVYLLRDINYEMEGLFSDMLLTQEIIDKHSLNTEVLNSKAIVDLGFKNEREALLEIARSVIDLISEDEKLKLILIPNWGADVDSYYLGPITDKSVDLSLNPVCLYDALNPCKDGSLVYFKGDIIQLPADYVEEYKGLIILSNGSIWRKQSTRDVKLFG